MVRCGWLRRERGSVGRDRLMTEKMSAMAEEIDQAELARQLLAQAKEQGIELVGPGGLLNQLTGSVLETALEDEMTEHLGYDKHDPAPARLWQLPHGTRANIHTRGRAGAPSTSQ